MASKNPPSLEPINCNENYKKNLTLALPLVKCLYFREFNNDSNCDCSGSMCICLLIYSPIFLIKSFRPNEKMPPRILDSSRNLIND